MIDPVQIGFPSPGPGRALRDQAASEQGEKPGFCFTDPGCRTDVRIGALLALAAVFLWLWWGPANCSRLYLLGVPFLLWGVPMQALQSRSGRPGYPWKLGLALAIGGLAMWPDLLYREAVGGARQVQPVAPLLAFAGLWIIAWWPVARIGAKPVSAEWR